MRPFYTGCLPNLVSKDLNATSSWILRLVNILYEMAVSQSHNVSVCKNLRKTCESSKFGYIYIYTYIYCLDKAG